MFKELKESITPQMAAERYGIKVSRNGMACCPFHDDKNPSLKLYDDHYYCFGCQKNGDVIDFTSRLFNITAFEAAQKLKTDFYINKERTSVIETLRKIKSQEKQEDQCSKTGKSDTNQRQWMKRSIQDMKKPAKCWSACSTLLICSIPSIQASQIG